MRTKKNESKHLGAAIALLIATAAPGAFAQITLPTISIPAIWYATVVDLDFSAAGSTVYTEHNPLSTGTRNELHLIATATLSEFLVGGNTPLSTTAPRLNYHVIINGASNPTAANLGHIKGCQQAALLAASNPAKFKLQLSYRATSVTDLNAAAIATQISLGTDAAYGAAYTNVRCSITRR